MKLTKASGSVLRFSVCHDLSGAAENAHVHLLGVQIDSTVILVLFDVEFHLASSLVGVFWLAPQIYHPFEEALHSIKDPASDGSEE